jgi:hypothetical protein
MNVIRKSILFYFTHRDDPHSSDDLESSDEWLIAIINLSLYISI